MGKRILSILSVVIIMSMLLSASAFTPTKTAKTVADMNIFKTAKFDAHYRVPNDAAIQNMLKEEQVSLDGTMKAMAVQDFVKEFVQRNWDTPDPAKLRELMKVEWDKTNKGPAAVADRSIKSLVTLVEFNPASETWTSQTNENSECVDTEVTFAGPLHNEIAPPGPYDNNTIWYDDTTPELYEQIYFGEGKDAGVTIHHPNVGDVKMGTMANYYLEMSNGLFAPAGEVYPTWFQADHSEAWYGEDGCGGSHNVRAQDLVQEVLDKLNAADPTFNWEAYDGNGDGVVDNFTVIHAGAGQEAGGGVQGAFAIWSHASMVGWPDGVQVCTKGSAGCPDRDIFVSHYSMDPENIDLGVIAEEFGHAAFGLPDLYTTDTQMSLSNWAIMESGSWNGKLGGSEPAPFPLFFKYMLGWAKVREIDYKAKASTTMVGQLENPPKGTYSGIKINLPDKEITTENPLGTGKAWWSDLGNGLTNTITTEVDLTPSASPVLSFLTHWSIEEDWDYGYVEVSTDGGATWTMLTDQQGQMRTTDPNGNNLGVGLTGEGEGTLTFDLAPYVGQKVQIRLAYITDAAAQWDGWWVDNIAVTDGATTLFSDDVEGAAKWVADGWQVVPLTKTYPRYYLVEWRNYSGTDNGLKYPYITTFSDVDNWVVERVPYVAPGMLVTYRDSTYAFDYTLNDSTYDPPSLGPKHGLILVDSHYWPLSWTDTKYSSGAGLRLSNRAQPFNAAFSDKAINPQSMKLDLGCAYNPATGVCSYGATPTIYETKEFPAPEPIAGFHDSVGYYPGLWYKPSTGGLFWWQREASAVVPAQGIYTTKITDINQNLMPDLFGETVGGMPLGTGNPGDSGVQYGLHIQVTNSWGSKAAITTWNAPGLIDASIKVNKTSAKPGQILTYVVRITNTGPLAAPQSYTAQIPVPAGTTFFKLAPAMGMSYDKTANVINIEPWLLIKKVPQTFIFMLKVNADTPAGAAIDTTVTVTDDALGDVATATTTVK